MNPTVFLLCLQKFVRDPGELKSLNFKSVRPNGYDVFQAVFENGKLIMNLQLTEEGRVERAGIGPG